MSAWLCGCDPEENFYRCSAYPECVYGRDERKPVATVFVYESEPMSELTDVGIRNSDPSLVEELRDFSTPLTEMSLNHYQRSLHTYKDRHHECHALGVVGELAEVIETLQNVPAWLSVDREVFIAAGRIADMVKKATAHGVALDRDALKKELGDVLWYITAVASDNALTLEEIAQANISKLQARYPTGFVKGGGVREDAASVNLRTETEPVLPTMKPPSRASFFGCGCSEQVIDGFIRRTYCPNGECRKLKR